MLSTIPWDRLRGRIEGSVALPGSPAYDATTPWVMSAPVYRPSGIVMARSADDVVLVDTRAMDDLYIDVQAARATLGAGCLWSQVIAAAGQHGLVPVCGSAPDIGAIGFLTGGGVGPLSRTLGVGSDRVRAFTVVTGAGEVRRATATENTDLFWGLRGGKSTLGIVVSAEIDLVALDTFYGGCLYFAGDDIATVLRAWAPWAAALPDEGNTSIAITQLPTDAPAPAEIVGRMVLAVRFAWLGDESEGARAAAAVAGVATPVLGGFDVMRAADLGAIHSDPVDPMPFRDEGFLLADFPADAVETLLATVGPGSKSTLAFVEVRRLGGRASQPAGQSDAFCGRIGEWNLWVGSPPVPDLDTLLHRFDRVLAPMRRWSTGWSMPNFLISDDAGDMPRLWDAPTYRRLQNLAERYDPQRVFAVGQTVVRPVQPAGVAG